MYFFFTILKYLKSLRFVYFWCIFINNLKFKIFWLFNEISCVNTYLKKKSLHIHIIQGESGGKAETPWSVYT
jgi:hypothetical protein